MAIERVTALDDQVVAILQRHFDMMHSQGPAESCHVMKPKALLDSGAYVVAWRQDGTLQGIGALKHLSPGHGELKSMHTVTEARGRGIGKAILTHLIDHARMQGLSQLSLETGSYDEFIAARSLYSHFGFNECPPFGDYTRDPLSTYMTRRLDA